MDYNFSFLLV